MIVSRTTAGGTARRSGRAAAGALAALLGLASLATTPTPAKAAGAADDHTVLILSSTVSGGATSVEAVKATALGMTVELVDGPGWTAKSSADFRTYRALILGDPTCGSVGAVSAAESNVASWGPILDGNVMLIGTDEKYHDSQGGNALSEKAVGFATSEVGKTGALISLSCYYHNTAAMTPVPLLDGINPGGFTVTGVGCYNDAHLVATHPAIAGLTDTQLSNWSCSVHEAFDNWPSDFAVLAIAKGIGTVFTATDGTVGTPYILARGKGLRARGLSISPTVATNPTGTAHTVTANLRDGDDNPITGQVINFKILDGSINAGAAGTCSPADCTTDASGNVTFTYTGAAGVGTDTILAFVDGTETTPANGVPDPGEPQVRATKNWIVFDPFGGLGKTTKRTLKLKIHRPEGADGVRCVQIGEGATPDFDDLPYTPFPEGQDDIELDVTLTGDNGNDGVCCQFAKLPETTTTTTTTTLDETRAVAAAATEGAIPILQPVCASITLGTCEGFPASTPGCFCGDLSAGTVGTCATDGSCTCLTEICGNCIDDDLDGKVDYEDEDCCNPAAAMSVKSSKVLPSKADIKRSRLKLKSILGFPVNAMTDGGTLQIRNAAGELFCTNIAAEHWMKVRGRTVFWDPVGAFAKGLTDGAITTKKKGVGFRTHGDRVDVSGFTDQLTVTFGSGRQCSSSPVTLKKKKGNRLIFP
jgi:hypothetical protein